jgi:preflagellin peptidase FlaK
MIEVLFVSAALAGGALASYTDLKSGVIPNRLSFSLIGLGLGGYLLYSLYLGNLELFLLVLKNFIIIFIIGYLFWFLGGWSAGDAKELMFLAALVPQYPEFLKPYFAPVVPPYPFALTMLFNTFLAIFPFIALYAIIISFAKVGTKKFITPLLDYRSYGYRAIILVAGYSFAMLLGHGLLFLPAVLALGLLKDQRISLGLALALVGAYTLFGGGEPATIVKYFFLTSLLLASLGFFLNALRILRKEGLRSDVRITELGSQLRISI